MTPEAHDQRRRWRPLRLLLIAIGGLAGLLLLLLAAALLLVDTDAVVAAVKERVLPRIGDRIGREVTVGAVDVRVLPTPAVRMEDLRVEGAGERPLLASEVVRARLDLWALVRSLGREIRLDSVELRGVEANVVRHPNGAWDFESIAERYRASGAPGTGSPRVRALSIDRVRIEEGTVRIVDQGAAGGAAVATWSGIEADARNVAPGEPLALTMRAALQSDSPNFELDLQIDPLPFGSGEPQAGSWPEVRGSVELRDVPLGTLRNLLPGGLAEITTGGRVHFRCAVQTEGNRYRMDGDGSIRELRLRNQLAEASFRFDGTLDPANRAVAIALRDLDLQGPGVELGGEAQLRSSPTRFEFALEGPLLDLDAILGAMPPRERPPDAPLLPPALRRSLQQASGSGTIAVDRLVSGALTATDARLRAMLRGGVLELEQARAGFYGGELRADGTTARLAQATPSWKLEASLDGVDLAEAMEAIAGTAPLRGSLDARVDVEGAGVDWEAVREGVDGSASLALDEGRLATLDLDAAVADALAQGLRRIGQPASAERIERGDGMALRDLRARVRVQDGWMILQQPIAVRTSFGTVELRGRIGLDWQLDLQGNAMLAPGFVARISGGTLRPERPVAVPLKLGGTLRAPAVQPFDAETLARSLLPVGRVERRVEEEVERARERARREARRRAGKILRDAF